MSWDLDQIELRVLAHLSQDNALTSILRDENRHIHKETCSKIYGIPINRVSKDSQEYMMTKNITFGIVYLISAQGLHHQLVERGLNLSLDDCKQWIKEWYGIYDGVFKYQEHIKALARREGRVTSMLGRYRLTPGARSTKPSLVRDTLRQAVNHPVQTGAQEVLKAGMVKMWPYIRKYRKSIRALLQVHDELLFEVSDTEDGRYKSYADLQITYAMTNAMQLSVPIRVSKSEGSSWSELK
jgi:DNA polymerase-1